MEYKLILGDCLIKLKELEDNSIDSIVTDPPYGISFMGQKWDYDVPSVDVWKECYRVLKPGGHLLSFSGSRTYHRMAVNIEDAGFEIRDQIMWVYGSGFPKSLNVGKAIDKKLGNEREVLEVSDEGIAGGTGKHTGNENVYNYKKTFNITKETSEYEGWGTALKPAHEPIVLARKPFRGDVASNVLEHGTGAINIDACRVGDEEIKTNAKIKGESFNSLDPIGISSGFKGCEESTHIGRWPANFIHDGLEEEWSKYFYCPKANKKDRNEGCEELKEKKPVDNLLNNCGPTLDRFKSSERHNNHPTVKPTELMRYLCRLITPKNGTVLDPFMGSGSTGKAAILEGFSFIGIELSQEYLNIAEKRINHAITDNE
jgi:site-specific DNA-methyltransferase (adenine-specific)